MAKEYITFAIPLEPQPEFGIKIHPLYKTRRDFGIVDGNSHSFINFLWYGKQLPKHSLMKRAGAFFTRTCLPELVVEKHLCIRDCSKKLEKKLLSFKGVEKIDTPEWYKEDKYWRKR